MQLVRHGEFVAPCGYQNGTSFDSALGLFIPGTLAAPDTPEVWCPGCDGWHPTPPGAFLFVPDKNPFVPDRGGLAIEGIICFVPQIAPLTQEEPPSC